MTRVPRSIRQILHSEIDVKSWAENPPSCAAVRPPTCIACRAPSRPAGSPLVIVGHGLRTRTIEGPPAPSAEPALIEIAARRYACRACDAIMVVVPRGVARARRYSLSAIAIALALWSHSGQTATTVRRQTSTAKVIGAASATRWASLRRWTRDALALFGIEPRAVGTIRDQAARIASFIASHAPEISGPVPIDAFFGAPFCPSR